MHTSSRCGDEWTETDRTNERTNERSVIDWSVRCHTQLATQLAPALPHHAAPCRATQRRQHSEVRDEWTLKWPSSVTVVNCTALLVCLLPSDVIAIKTRSHHSCSGSVHKMLSTHRFRLSEYKYCWMDWHDMTAAYPSGAGCRRGIGNRWVFTLYYSDDIKSYYTLKGEARGVILRG